MKRSTLLVAVMTLIAIIALITSCGKNAPSEPANNADKDELDGGGDPGEGGGGGCLWDICWGTDVMNTDLESVSASTENSSHPITGAYDSATPECGVLGPNTGYEWWTYLEEEQEVYGYPRGTWPYIIIEFSRNVRVAVVHYRYPDLSREAYPDNIILYAKENSQDPWTYIDEYAWNVWLYNACDEVEIVVLDEVSFAGKYLKLQLFNGADGLTGCSNIEVYEYKNCGTCE